MTALMKIAVSIACAVGTPFGTNGKQADDLQKKCQAFYSECMKRESSRLGDDYIEEDALDTCTTERALK